MSKISFEMNDIERQLHHIANGLDYAICTFGIGLSGTGEFNIATDEVINLQSRIGNNLMEAYKDINTLLKAVEEEEEKPQLVFNTIEGADELKELIGCKVYLIENIENVEQNFHGTKIVFFNEQTGKYINLLKDDDGELCKSQWY